MEIISRKEAKEKGLKRYFTGKQCKYGHIEERWTENSDCIGCCRERSRAYREKNPEKVKETLRRWKETNPERYKELSKKYRDNSKEYKREYSKKWNRENRKYYRDRKRALYASDPEFKAKQIMRDNFRRVLKMSGNAKTKDTVSEFGYTPSCLIHKLESLFLDGMSWDNHGIDWNIDHKNPLSVMVAEGRTAKEINCLSNLIPMWKLDNFSKGGRTLEEWLEEKGEDSEEYRLYSKFL